MCVFFVFFIGTILIKLGYALSKSVNTVHNYSVYFLPCMILS